MPLTFDLSRCPDTDALFQEVEEFGQTVRKPKGITEAFIFASLVTGLGKNWSLDEAFAPEFYARIKLYEKIAGRLAYRPDGKGGIEDWPVTPEDVAAHVGMTVNVAPVSRAAFIKNVITRDLDAAKRRYEQAIATKATATERGPVASGGLPGRDYTLDSEGRPRDVYSGDPLDL